MATKSFFAKLQANPSLAATVVKKKEPFAPRPKVQEDKQNALSRKVNAIYFHQTSVPVDPRNGLDMRTMCTAQDPSYQEAHTWNTYVDFSSCPQVSDKFTSAEQTGRAGLNPTGTH
jgi:hypothetical protein